MVGSNKQILKESRLTWKPHLPLGVQRPKTRVRLAQIFSADAPIVRCWEEEDVVSPLRHAEGRLVVEGYRGAPIAPTCGDSAQGGTPGHNRPRCGTPGV